MNEIKAAIQTIFHGDQVSDCLPGFLIRKNIMNGIDLATENLIFQIYACGEHVSLNVYKEGEVWAEMTFNPETSLLDSSYVTNTLLPPLRKEAILRSDTSLILCEDEEFRNFVIETLIALPHIIENIQPLVEKKADITQVESKRDPLAVERSNFIKSHLQAQLMISA